MRRATTLLVGMAFLLVEGCSAAVSSAGAPVSTSATSGSQPSPNNSSCADFGTCQSSTASQSPPDTAIPLSFGPGSSIHFTFTSPEGWHYTGTVPYPALRMDLTKDITSSPLGKAQVVDTVSGTPEATVSVPDDNPDRPNGPDLKIRPGQLVYEVPNAIAQLYAAAFGLCGPYPVTSPLEPFPGEIKCETYLEPGIPSLSGTSSSEPEADVDRVIATLGSARVVYVLNFSSGGVDRRCAVWVGSDGTVTRSPAWIPKCGQAVVTTS